MDFQKDFDELFNAILTDYKNQFPEADITQGSLIYIKSACMASALWGLYKYQEYISKQIFPDTADTENLEHHAWVRGLTRNPGESDSAFLARLLDHLRRPPAGGNKYDYVKWAREIENVAEAYCFPLAQGLGTVDVLITADEDDTGSEIPSTSARSGTITTVSVGKLIDSAASFNTGHTVTAGDIVRNTVQGTEATVTSVDSATQLTLSTDIFKYAGENYHTYCHTGTSSDENIEQNKLIDLNADFENTTYTINKGDVVRNITDGTKATVVKVDSGTQLSLSEDIFTATDKAYVVESLVARVKEYIDAVRPVTASKTRVLVPAVLTQPVTMSVTGASVNKTLIESDIEAYIKTLIPGQTLYRSQLVAIAIRDGADNVDLTVPASDVTPGTYEMIRPGVVTVNVN